MRSRNPLTALGGFARRLHKIAEGEKEKEYAEIVLTEVDRLERILKDVLTFSRDARGHLEKHDIEEIIHDTLKIYEDLCREQSIAIEIRTGENLRPVLIDRDQVRQALDNLITNAVDAMPDHGRLTISAGREELHDVTYMFLRSLTQAQVFRRRISPLSSNRSSAQKISATAQASAFP